MEKSSAGRGAVTADTPLHHPAALRAYVTVGFLRLEVEGKV